MLFTILPSTFHSSPPPLSLSLSQKLKKEKFSHTHTKRNHIVLPKPWQEVPLSRKTPLPPPPPVPESWLLAVLLPRRPECVVAGLREALLPPPHRPPSAPDRPTCSGSTQTMLRAWRSPLPLFLSWVFASLPSSLLSTLLARYIAPKPELDRESWPEPGLFFSRIYDLFLNR